MRLLAAKFVALYRMPAGQVQQKRRQGCRSNVCGGATEHVVVPVKSIDQQAEHLVHRASQGYIHKRTALINRIRGLLSELGIVGLSKPTPCANQAQLAMEQVGRAVSVGIPLGTSAAEAMGWRGAFWLLTAMSLLIALMLHFGGTGYSNLSYLSRFPTDTLESDQPFVNRMNGKSNDANILSAMIIMVKSLMQRVSA